MAREIHEREDLLRDARALVPRVMLRVFIDGREQAVFVGFRGDSLSIYFGDDPVFHFNGDGELRRAFVDGRLIKAERRRLVFLNRRRSKDESALERLPQDEAAEQALLMAMQRGLDQLRTATVAETFEVAGEASASGEALPRLVAWLEAHRDIRIAASPRLS